MFMLPMPKFKVIHPDGHYIEGRNPVELLEYLRREDWNLPLDIYDFKRSVAKRVLISGQYLLFWDASSFLFACSRANVFQVLVDGVRI